MFGCLLEVGEEVVGEAAGEKELIQEVNSCGLHADQGCVVGIRGRLVTNNWGLVRIISQW